MTPAIRVQRLTKSFGARRARDAIDLEIRAGEMVALIGASGSGKSTLLRQIAGLACADRGGGSVEVNGRLVQRDGQLSPDVRALRAEIGFVFQHFNLVGRLPLAVNVLTGALHRTPLWRSLLRRFRREDVRRALEALARVGIAEHALQRTSTLSGGQQQRGAIAHALLQGARVVLADEPIASLDPVSARRVMEILVEINRSDGCTVLVSLHQVNFALRYCPRVVALRAGRVVYDGTATDLTPALLRELYGAEADEVLALADPVSLPGRRDEAAGARAALWAAKAA